MSLEQALAANTAAIERLIAVLEVRNPPAPVVAPEAAQSIEVIEKAAAAREAAAARGRIAYEQAGEPNPEPTPKAAKPAATRAKAAPKAEPPPTPEATLAQAGSAITGLAQQRGREAAVAVLKKFGVARVSELPADKYGEVIEACLHELSTTAGEA